MFKDKIKKIYKKDDYNCTIYFTDGTKSFDLYCSKGRIITLVNWFLYSKDPNLTLTKYQGSYYTGIDDTAIINLDEVS